MCEELTQGTIVSMNQLFKKKKKPLRTAVII